MNAITNLFESLLPKSRVRAVFFVLVLIFVLAAAGVVLADVPDRTPPGGAVPNPGTQQQELANITFPAPYNVYEFVVTCAGCHGGGIDQNAGHFSNWAGGSMASAARDPVFRANQIGVNNLIASITDPATGLPLFGDGAGNVCFRCHSPNGWYSGRFDPNLGGYGDGRNMIHSILASTDDEGILCEFCHRAIGNVTFKRADLVQDDPVWNLLAGIDDWPHMGGAYVDQAGDPTIAAGNPYGDTSLKINDGMTYVGKYSGSVDVYSSDIPLTVIDPVTGLEVPTPYTGQTYGIYPPGWTGPKNPVPAGMPQFNSAGEEIAYNVDGSVPIHFEVPIGPPYNPVTGQYDYQAQALSLEHPTVGDRPDGYIPTFVPADNEFLRSSEFCGSCHDLTVPILDHGMPEQRTYTEWKYSIYNTDSSRCQDCHMPTMKHEFADDAPVSVNPDPALAGWFPYAKDRNPQGGTAFHKFAGANRDLPDMMKLLYPEVDLEVLGAPTGNDPRVFPGMLSDRSTMWDRAKRNAEISLMDGVDVEIVDGLVNSGLVDNGDGTWSVQVKVTNNTGHRIPSGYPDGRRFWISLNVSDAYGATVYESGVYDDVNAELMTDSNGSFQRALSPNIDSLNNAVMVYERVTGTCVDADGAAIFPKPSAGIPAGCTPSSALTNNFILFDNRIPPAGFSYADYRASGVKFWNYGASYVPFEDMGRYPDGQGFDLVTYTFTPPVGVTPVNVNAELYWQTHTRDLMEHLRIQDSSTLRPEGPPSIYAPNYPLTPTYLSDEIDGFATMTAMDGTPLNDNWGGIAYAAWLLTGKGAPYLVGMADTAVAIPAAPANPAVAALDSFTLQVSWDPVADADGYLVWVLYGVPALNPDGVTFSPLDTATADWDKLTIVYGANSFTHEALNVGKTFGYKIQAFNGAGMSAESLVVAGATSTDIPLPPENLLVSKANHKSITLAWYDSADNELGFVIERQDVPVIGNFYEIARIPTPNNGGVGGVSYTDKNLPEGQCWNYRVAAYNDAGMSTYSLPVQGCTGGPPTGTISLTADVISGAQVDLAWSGATGVIVGYRIERSTDGGATWPTVFNVVDPNAASYSDLTVQPSTTYTYRVIAYNNVGLSAPSNTATVTTLSAPPLDPSNLTATAGESPGVVWIDLPGWITPRPKMASTSSER